MDRSLQLRLLVAKQALHHGYDALNEAWSEAEQALVALNVGRDVHVLMYEEDSGSFGHHHPDRAGWNDAGSIESGSWSHYLTLTRRTDEWRICYVSVPTGWDWCNDYCGEWKPIDECSKEIRVMAAEHLSELMIATIEAAEELAEEVEEAANKVRLAIAPLGAA